MSSCIFIQRTIRQVPGQAIDFSELLDDFAELDTVVIVASTDECFSHRAFRDKHGLSLCMLADTDAEACESYGVLRHANYGVTPRQHAEETLNRIKEMDEACR